MIRIKPGVKLPAEQLAMIVMVNVNEVFTRYGYAAMITSGMDGRHSKTSKHQLGLAWDFRSRQVEDRQALMQMVQELQRNLDGYCDVILEDTHLHIEVDPRWGNI